MSKDDTGPAGFSKIARRLSDLFNFLATLDDSGLPRRGRREKDGMVIEYSFGKRTLAEDAPDRGEESQPRANESRPRRAAKPSPLEVLEPVTDLFDEPDEVLLLFELPGVNRRDVRCVLDGDILRLEATTGDRLYRKEMLMEPKLAEGAPHLRLRNGILEVRLAKQQ
jgi:HSP20 family protein